MLYWGPPKKFVAGGWDPKQEKSEILPIENGRTADILLEWINKQLGRYKHLLFIGSFLIVNSFPNKLSLPWCLKF